jgi:hypothetical protein
MNPWMLLMMRIATNVPQQTIKNNNNNNNEIMIVARNYTQDIYWRLSLEIPFKNQSNQR